MEDLFDTLLFTRDPSPEQREALRAKLDEEEGLARAWAHWTRARTHLRDRLQERISDRRLLVLYVLDQEGDTAALTDSERAALDAARDDLERAIEDSPALQQIVERIREERADFEEAWALHEAENSESEARAAPSRDRTDRAPHAPDGRGRQRWTRRFALASLVVGLVVGALLLWPEGPSTTTVTVAEGERRTVELGDGSTVRLAGAATFTYPTAMNGDAPRRVTLDEGRAFFDVQHRQREASFVVQTPTATATVLGTKFGVTTTADTTEVLLASGSVRVGPADEATGGNVILEPGEASRVAAGGAPAAPTPADLTTALDWTGLFVFRAVPMQAIAQRLSEHYDVQVTVAPSLADETVTGTFEREQSASQVLDVLATTLGAEVRRDGSTYRLTAR
jgi:ferric-dicitrate binding protein FerR (iron transport regulator)